MSLELPSIEVIEGEISQLNKQLVALEQEARLQGAELFNIEHQPLSFYDIVIGRSLPNRAYLMCSNS